MKLTPEYLANFREQQSLHTNDTWQYQIFQKLFSHIDALESELARERASAAALLQKQWEECVDAICPTCREFGWPINDEHGNLFHIHDAWEGTRPCLAEALFRIPSRAITTDQASALLDEKREYEQNVWDHVFGGLDPSEACGCDNHKRLRWFFSRSVADRTEPASGNPPATEGSARTEG